MAKRETKKEVYARYNIEYKAGKIYHPVLGWVNPVLINGNAKIGKGCYHYSILPTTGGFTVYVNEKEYKLIGTCPTTCRGCYATNGNYRFQSVKNALGMRTWLAQNDIDFLKRAIMAQIEADKIDVLRIHAAGDFFSLAYVEMWRTIAKRFPDCLMWSYTKKAAAEKAFNDIPNINIVKSIVPGFGFNFGHCDYILNVYKALKETGKDVYVCKCGTDKEQHCINCGACRKCEHVLFIEHGTEYNAENDAVFPVLKEIIDKQENIALRA